MKVLILNNHLIHEMLPVDECIGVMERMFLDLAEGRAHNPLRSMIFPPGAQGLMGVMPGYRGGDDPAFGVKIVCVFKENPARGKDTHQGLVSLFDGGTGEPLAFLNASAVTAIRTAAVSGLATRLLARPESSTLAIIGSGMQAATHLEAMAAVLPLQSVNVASRRPEHARRFAAASGVLYRFPIFACDTAKEAVEGADVVVTVTSSAEPVVRREWIAPGCHINAVGSSVAKARELESALVAAGSLFVDRRESAENESGDYLVPLREGLITPDHIRGEIGDLLTGRVPGRRSPEEITIFKSLGLALEDVAVAQHLYRKAQDVKAGDWIDF